MMASKNSFLLVLSWIGIFSFSSSSASSLEGRFSFSLTTFDPNGKLGQVEQASIAASLGTPVFAVIQDDGSILMAAPQILPSPFMHDDGTARFAAVTPHIVLAHSGIAADGRVLVAAAQRLAVEHAYTFDEEIPVDLFLEELSLLFQEYTMRPASRPFGATVLVAHVPFSGAGVGRAQLFRVDPSGAVMAIESNHVIINGKFPADVQQKLRHMTNEGNETTNNSSGRERLAQLVQEYVFDASPTVATKESNEQGKKKKISLPSYIITASLTKEAGLEIKRRKLTKASHKD